MTPPYQGRLIKNIVCASIGYCAFPPPFPFYRNALERKPRIIWIVICTEMRMTKTKNNIDSLWYRDVHDENKKIIWVVLRYKMCMTKTKFQCRVKNNSLVN